MSLDALNVALGEFGFWYNQVRPHQNLDGRTPAEAWAGVNPFVARIKKEYWFEAWGDCYRGFICGDEAEETRRTKCLKWAAK